MEVFGELLKDDVGILSLAVLAVTILIFIFFIFYFLSKSGKE